MATPTLRLAAITGVAAAALAACATGARDDRTLRIVSASYSVQDGSVPCDVSTKVASTCNGQAACTVVARSALCPMGDPAPNRPKRLSVQYACGATSMPRAEVADGRSLDLACPP
jgi:hypothetical protein